MEFCEFLKLLEDSQSEDTEISLTPWNTLKEFRDQQIPLVLEYTSTVIQNSEIPDKTKGLAMLLFQGLYTSKTKPEEDPIPPDILPDFLQSVLSLFETENLQVVSISASLVFQIVSAEMRKEIEIPIINQFADALQTSTNPYITFGYSSVLFQICQEFTLPIEDNFMILSAVLEQLSSGTLPPVVASCVISIFRSTVPILSPEFIESQLFLDLLEMLLGLTSVEGIEAEAILTWSEIISCRPVQDEVMDAVSDTILEDMNTSDEPAVLIACCVFWWEATYAFNGRTEVIAPYDARLFDGIFRILCMRRSADVSEEADELQQTAERTLKTFTKTTRATSVYTLQELIEEHITSDDVLESNASLLFLKLVARYGLQESWSDVAELTAAALDSGLPLLQLQGLKTLKIMARRVDAEDAELLAPLASAAAGCDSPQQLRTELARLLGPLACQTAAGVSLEAASFLLELARDSDFEVAGAAFGSLADIGACGELGGIHGELVDALLDLLETRLADDADSAVDAAVTLAPFAESMGDSFVPFADRAAELLARALSVSPRVLRPLAAVAALSRTAVLPFVWAVADSIVANAAEDAPDEGFACAAEAVPVFVAAGFDAELSEALPAFVELAGLGLVGARGAIALRAGATALLELRAAGVEIDSGILPGALNAMAAQFATLEDEAELALCALGFLDFAAALLPETAAPDDAAAAAFSLCGAVCEAFQASDIDVAKGVLAVLQALAVISPALPARAAAESPSISKTLRKMRAFSPMFARQIEALDVILEPGDGSP